MTPEENSRSPGVPKWPAGEDFWLLLSPHVSPHSRGPWTPSNKICYSHWPCWVGIKIPASQKKKVRLREVRWRPQVTQYRWSQRAQQRTLTPELARETRLPGGTARPYPQEPGASVLEPRAPSWVFTSPRLPPPEKFLPQPDTTPNAITHPEKIPPNSHHQ